MSNVDISIQLFQTMGAPNFMHWVIIFTLFLFLQNKLMWMFRMEVYIVSVILTWNKNIYLSFLLASQDFRSCIALGSYVISKTEIYISHIYPQLKFLNFVKRSLHLKSFMNVKTTAPKNMHK